MKTDGGGAGRRRRGNALEADGGGEERQVVSKAGYEWDAERSGAGWYGVEGSGMWLVGAKRGGGGKRE